tara:strand:+ start:402 stop:962 length:561 start_codon:yes stop_codon:yes gene_type:complete
MLFNKNICYLFTLIIIFFFHLSFLSAFTVDKSNSYLGFKIHQFGLGTVNGEFKEYTIEAQFEDSKIISLNATLDISSLKTGNKTRDRHLQSKQFFYTAKHPYITFQLTHPLDFGIDSLMKGRLSIRGKHIDVDIPVIFTDISSDDTPIFEAQINEFTLDRTFYGLTTYKKLINHLVDTNIRIRFIK